MARLAIPVYGLRPSPPETGRETILKGWAYPRSGDALAWVEAPSAAVAVRAVPVLPNRGNCTDASGTRTMVLVSGRENPRPGVIPSRHSLTVRLTPRNVVVPEIQALRADPTKMEMYGVLGIRPCSSVKQSAFGARAYRPHLKICRSLNRTPQDLTVFGEPEAGSLCSEPSIAVARRPSAVTADQYCAVAGIETEWQR